MAKPSISVLLDRECVAFDALRAEVSGGIRHQRHFDDIEAKARAIAGRIVEAFRGAQS